jgi:hypothetical protein
VLLQAHERLDLGFSPPAASPSEARSYVLEVSGTSTSGEVLAARARPSGEGESLPASIQLGPLVPNPTQQGASLRLGLPEQTRIRGDVFDLPGRRVATIATGVYPAGWHTLAWDGRNRAGSRVSAGVYLLRITVGARALDRRLVVMP